jgi:endo-1,4-beta-xylanase
MKNVALSIIILFSSMLLAQDNNKVPELVKKKSIYFKDVALYPVGISATPDVLFQNQPTINTIKENYNSFTLRFYNSILYKNSTPTQWGTIDFTWPDKYLELMAKFPNFKRFHGHCLVYHIALAKDQEAYIKNASIADFEANYKLQIETILKRYKDKGISNRSYDVINEVIKNDSTAFYDATVFRQKYASDEDYYQFIKKCFTWAKTADPEAKLFYNDYGMEWGDYKSKKIIQLVEKLKKEKIVVNGKNIGIIDGIGHQTHIDIDSFNYYKFAASLKYCADTQLLVHLSEVDVSVNINDVPLKQNPYTEQRKQIQADLFRKIPEMYYSHVPESQRFGITFWDLTDTDSWIPTNQRKKSKWDNATPFYSKNCEKKPAYYGFASGLAGYTITNEK